MIKLVFENNIQFFFIYERIKKYDYFLFKNIYNFIFILHLRNLKNKGYVCLIIGFFKKRGVALVVRIRSKIQVST